MAQVEIVRIVFKETSALILLREEYFRYGSVFNLCKELAIDLKDFYRAKAEKIDIKDFPKNEWDG